MAMTTTTITPVIKARGGSEKSTDDTIGTTSPSKQNEARIRIVPPSEYKEAAACLSEAFRVDPVVRYAGKFLKPSARKAYPY
jgi:hypothetical protein